ncbi:MAG: anthranilate/aminodeoxychorismate synthase component II [Elusimicrobia bacterium CG08_land_8_20_14_0_20_44_26]|nr:MAG: anthranilate/aminodeoxychorismate synthase component II [Elusimicrobia bacterium CG08_land_8_20_14_0_20_44_26]
MKKGILFIDNYDSFVYNLVQYFGRVTKNIRVKRNDGIKMSEISSSLPAAIVISPGPGRPSGAGRSVEIIRKFYKEIPILGVCLGHQAIAYAFGGEIVHAREILHGKTSPIRHNGRDIFKGISNPFTATRYHSLVVKRAVPGVEITAKTPDGEIMALKLKNYPVYGVQFHPESILTEEGFKIVKNFCDIARI